MALAPDRFFRRVPSSIAAVVLLSACAGGGVTSGGTRSGGGTAPPPGDAGVGPPAAPVAVVQPWPATDPAAAWTVVDWTMDRTRAEAAIRAAGLSVEPRGDVGAKAETLEVAGAVKGWKAVLRFDPETRRVRTITVRGDPVDVEAAQRERVQLEARYGPPVETRVHWSKQCGNTAVEIEGPRPAWRFTQSQLRPEEAQTPIEPTTLKLAWGMKLGAAAAALKAAGFAAEPIRPPSRPVPSAQNRRKNKVVVKPAPRRPLPAPRGPKVVEPKVVEVRVKKGDEHLQLSIEERKGLEKVAVGRDVPDRPTAEQRAREAMNGVGACLSEAATESTTFKDRTAEAHLSITGFQGQRVVYERYRDPTSDADDGEDG